MRVPSRDPGLEPLVSILSPVFNESAHLQEMIDSVLQQSYPHLEVILVDDGSTDDTVAIAEQAQQRDSRVRVVSEGKLGKVRAFNRAYAESSGDVILLMGGDDVMPSDSVESRVRALRGVAGSDRRVAVFAHLRTFSLNRRFDGQVIPRDPKRGARSGGTLALSRALAEQVFPVPEVLISEDIWVGGAASWIADEVIDLPDIVLNYRIHSGNSNPRNRNFTQMTESMHARARANQLLADDQRLDLPEAARTHFNMLSEVEGKRYVGDVLGVLTHRAAPLSVRLRAVSMATPAIFEVRRRLFKLFSGW